MSTNLGFNHLITKRIQSSFSKNKDMQCRSRKIKDKSLSSNLEEISFNQSVDVKTYMPRQRHQLLRKHPSNTINFESQAEKGRRQNSLFFANSRRDFEGANARSVKLAYGSTSPKVIRQRINIYTSQKSIKQKKKRSSFSTNIRDQSQLLQTTHANSPTLVNNSTKQNQTVSVQKHLILAKYDKVKQLLGEEKFSQASIYLKQILPYIEDKGKRKELYFWLIAALMKCGGKLQIVENYIVECLQEFPNYYDVYLYWGKMKLLVNQRDQAIQIYQKAVSIDSKKSQAYLQLGGIYFQHQSYQQALQVYQSGYQKCVSCISIPVKLIQSYKQFKLSLQKDIKCYLQRIQQNCGRKSTQLLYLLGFIQNENSNYNEALIYFLESLKYNSSRALATKSLQYIIKIHIFKKDFYAACYDLQRARHLNIDWKKIDKYETFLEGVNFVMKKKNQEGIKILSKIKDSVSRQNSKKRISSSFSLPQQPNHQETYFPQDSEIYSLTIQYMAYAYFKLGNHKQAIKCYKLLQKVEKQLDNTSKYNMLLAEGIVMADTYHDFQLAVTKFQQAKKYLGKVEPFIYQAVVALQKRVYEQRVGSKKKLASQAMKQEEMNASVIEALNLLQQGYQVNPSSSNLLYHRTILHLYFSSIKTAMNDINICIQKAEQNLPKYFYLRGICFACSKNLKKAINEFSISLSLSKYYSISYLQRAKCYFLSGETEMGFQDLKVYMDQCPDDFLVHKWIGDLLFEGTSYNDCVKAYDQIGDKITLEALCMKMKAQFRVGNVKHVGETMTRIKSHQGFNQQLFAIDLSAYSLLNSLMSQSSTSEKEKEKHSASIQKKVNQLNDYLQSDVQKSKIFNLVDCMCLVGIGYFYTEKYTQAYESFLLVFQFFKSTTNKNPEKSKANISQDQEDDSVSITEKEKINTEFHEENLDLKEQDIYYNLLLCLLAMRDFKAVRKFVDKEMMASITSQTQHKVIQKIIGFLNQNSSGKSQKLPKTEKKFLLESMSKNSFKTKSKKQLSSMTCLLQPRVETSLNANLKNLWIPLTLQKSTLTIRTSMNWSPYHGTNDNLSFIANAKKLVQDLHAGYIDNMPEGPWIRRNQFGVLFTDNILDDGNQSSFMTTTRNQQQQEHLQEQNQDCDEDYDDQQGSLRRVDTNGSSENMKQRKKAFLKEMRLDLQIQSKLNKIIQKNQDGE